MDGSSLVPAVKAGRASGRLAYSENLQEWETEENALRQSLRTEEFHFLRNLHDGTEEWYESATDPGERKNIVDQVQVYYKKELLELRRVMNDKILKGASSNKDWSEAERSQIKDRLRRLGYAELGQERAMKPLVPPHGGKLLPLAVLDEARRREVREECRGLPQVRMSSREVSDVIMMASGAFSPLRGFLRHDDYKGVVRGMRLADGLLWPIPITLSVTYEEAGKIAEGSRVALVDGASGELMARMTVEEKYSYTRGEEALQVFGTEDHAHPGVEKIFAQGALYLGGPVEALSEGDYPQRYPEYARPAETRALFEEKGWSTVAALQTRNPLHRSHEYLAKVAMEVCDGVLLHPIVGALKKGDIPADVRMRCYQVLLDRYYPRERLVLRVYPMEMRYAGPREALLHAIIRQNFGCSHLIVGRDHAGVGKYYGPFDAQAIFDGLAPGDLAIQPLKMDNTFWCRRCGEMASLKTCPHAEADRLSISGTELRAMLAEGRRPPAEFSRPEVIEILIDYYRRAAGAKG